MNETADADQLMEAQLQCFASANTMLHLFLKDVFQALKVELI